MLQYCTNLLLVYARKPLHELVDRGAAGEILEEGVYRYSCSGESPGTANLAGLAFPLPGSYSNPSYGHLPAFDCRLFPQFLSAAKDVFPR